MNQLVNNNYGIPAINFEVGILTPREIEVIGRILLPSKNIAYDLNISEHTVTSHVTNIKHKTGLLDKYQMAYFLGTRQGLIN
jgi:DNA-binding CsgD family transcriptional regulator